LLQTALAQLAQGGRLVYSTCSIEPEENENVVEQVLRHAKSIRRVATSEAVQILTPHLAPGIQASDLFAGDGYFRTPPGVWQTDGFFAAILEKS
jgi:16S rRNA (cytosine967-C5)-methyltransferase